MNYDAPLFQQILEQPDDDAPRLVYADWLEENNDAELADLIRVQCELFMLERQVADEEQDIQSRSPELVRLRSRASELIEKRGWEWADQFQVSEWHYERGFVSKVQVSVEKSMQQVVEMVNRTLVRHVRDDQNLNDLGPFCAALPKLEKLTGLELLSLHTFEDSQLAEILQSPHLANLQTLILQCEKNGNLADPQVIIDGLHSPHRSNIQTLAVNVDGRYRGPSLEILTAIAESPYLRNLRVLNISNAGDEGDGPLRFTNYHHCIDGSKSSPTVSGARLTTDVVEQLLGSPNLENLECLDLRFTNALSECWKALYGLSKLPKLKKVFLGQTVDYFRGEDPSVLKNLPKSLEASGIKADIITMEVAHGDFTNR